MRKQRKFNVGDKVRLTAYKKDKIVGEVIGVFYTVYPDNCIVYKYDVLVRKHLIDYISILLVQVNH